MNTTTCPCCSNKAYHECCGLFIEAKELPQTAEELMRSRYTAFTQANMDYVASTMRGAAAATSDMSQTKAWAEQVKWEGLEIISADTNLTTNKRTLVEFKARYCFQDQPQEIHERSLFDLIDGRWFYVGEAPQRAAVQIGRNDLCHCGSGKKYKKCCL